MLTTLRRILKGRSTRRDAPPMPAPTGYDLRGLRFQVRDGGLWRDAPEQLSVPVGTRLSFRFALPREHDVAWSGATETSLTRTSSTASVAIRTTGALDVRVDVLDLDGRPVARLRTQVEVVTARHAA